MVPAELTKLVLIPVNCNLRQARLPGVGKEGCVQWRTQSGANSTPLRPPTSTVSKGEDLRQGCDAIVRAMVAPALVKAGVMNGTPTDAVVLKATAGLRPVQAKSLCKEKPVWLPARPKSSLKSFWRE